MITRRIVGTTLVAVATAVAGAGTASASTTSNPLLDVVESFETAVDECSSGMLTGAMGGASVGGMLGAGGGPLGVAVGAAIGGLVGEIGGGETSCEERVISGTAVADPDDVSRGHKGKGRK